MHLFIFYTIPDLLLKTTNNIISYSIDANGSIFQKSCLQFLHRNGNHWILSHINPQNLQYDCILYDSLMSHNNNLPNNTKSQLENLINFSSQLRYRYTNLMQQPNSVSCGLFTIDYANDIAFDISSKDSISNIPLMRQHIKDCLNHNYLTPFSKII